MAEPTRSKSKDREDMFQMMERFVAQINTQMNARFAEQLELSDAKFAQMNKLLLLYIPRVIQKLLLF